MKPLSSKHVEEIVKFEVQILTKSAFCLFCIMLFRIFIELMLNICCFLRRNVGGRTLRQARRQKLP
jgi:hypothetical protein